MKTYTMLFNEKSMTYEPVKVQAGLTIGGEKNETFMPLMPDFQVDDSPDVKSGVGGISSGLIEVKDKKLLDQGKMAEFMVVLKEPNSPMERKRMVDLLTSQMAFELKVTLYPVSTFMPGVPFNVVEAMARKTAGSISLLVEIPPNRMVTEPGDGQVILETKLGQAIELTAKCEKIDLETLTYEIATGPDHKPAIPFDRIEGVDNKSAFVHVEPIKKEDRTSLRLNPWRYIVGDGSLVEALHISFYRPQNFKDVEPEKILVPILCETNPLDVEFRIYRGEKELHRENITLKGDHINLQVKSTQENMNWKGTHVTYLVHNANPFFRKSHYDTGMFSLDEQRYVDFFIIRNNDGLTTLDYVDLLVEEEAYTASVKVYKEGWKPIDIDLYDLASDAGGDLSERMEGANLIVSVKGILSPLKGNVNSQDLGHIPIYDMEGSLTVNDELIKGELKEDKIIFPPKGNAVKGKEVHVTVELELDENIRDMMESIHESVGQLSTKLLSDFNSYARDMMLFLGKIKRDTWRELGENFFEKLAVTEAFFAKGLIFKKELDACFDLRAKAAEQIINNIVGLLVELFSLGSQMKGKQGSLLNSDTIEAQIKTTWHYKNVKRLKASSADFGKQINQAKTELLQLEYGIDDIINNKKLYGETLKRIEESKKAISKMEKLKSMTDDCMNLNEGQMHLALKKLQEEIGVAAITIPELKEEAAKYVFGQDMELYSAIGNSEDKSQVLVNLRRKIMNNEYANPGMLVPDLADFVYDKEKFDAFVEGILDGIEDFYNEMMAYLRKIPEYLSEEIRNHSMIESVVRESYLNAYKSFNLNRREGIEPSLSISEANVFSGMSLVEDLDRGITPDKSTQEKMVKRWLEEDRSHRQNYNELIIDLGKSFIRSKPGEDYWLNLNVDAFKMANSESDRLIHLIKDYKAAFGMIKASDEANRSYQHIDNMISNLSLCVSWGARFLSWVAIYSGVLAPYGLYLSKFGDLVDIGGAGLQAGLSVFYTLPELNGIVEGIPVFAYMLHESGTKKETIIDGPILNY